MTIPPGVKSADWARALEQFANVVGKDWVFTSDEDVDLYRDAYTPFRGEPELEKVASAALAPDSVEQVQQIVKIANIFKVPLYAISTGRNLGYGGSAPVYSGSVVLDLKRMNKVIDVNEELGTCIVEPGVSYFEMYRHLTDRGIKLMIDCPQPGWGSMVGNALDRGVGSTPRSDHYGSSTAMEVVLPDGEIVRTGIGAVAASKSWAFKYGFGPHVSGMFTQSNFGIVTKMGFHLMRMPEAVRFATIDFHHYDDLDTVVDTINHLYENGILTARIGVSSALMATLGDPDIAALYSRFGEVSAAEWDQLARDKKKSLYNITLTFFGPEKINAAHMDYAKEKFSVLKDIVISDDHTYRFPFKEADIRPDDRYRIGIPTLQSFTQMTASVNHGHFFFAPAIPMSAKDLRAANTLFARISREEGVYNGFSNGVCYFPKTFIFTYAFFMTDDVELNRKKRKCAARLIKEGAEHGYAEYRTPPAFQDNVMTAYSWNDNALRRMHERIKDVLDPNGIYAAGKSGIWPKHLRTVSQRADNQKKT